MGKGKRLKAERAAEAARPLATREPDQAMLLEAVGAVGEAFGDRADCAAAAAFLVLTGRNLGFALTPRPVSLLARDSASGDVAVLGPKASALLSDADRARVEDHTPEGRNTGHMVVTSESPRFLFDPNLRQLSGYGLRAPSVAFPIRSTTPADGGWRNAVAGLDLRYIMDDENTALSERYEAALEFFVPHAEALATLLRQGASPATIRKVMRDVDAHATSATGGLLEAVPPA